MPPQRTRRVPLSLHVLVATLCLLSVTACSRPAMSPDTPGGSPGSGLSSLSGVASTLVDPGPDDPNAVTVASAIRRVTVYSDRALVAREATAAMKPQPTVLAFKHLPGWVDDASVRASSSTGRILDVRVSRSFLARATDASYRSAEAAARDMAGRMGALDDELLVLAAQRKQVEDIKAFSMEKLPKDVMVANVGIDTYASVVAFVGKTMRETAQRRRAVDAERLTLAPEIEAAGHRVEELKALAQLEETTVYVTVQGTTSSDATVALTYMLPGATWEPVHEVRFTDASASSVEVTSFAVVTQATGEEWSGAELVFSTQSATAASRIPELEALTLGDTRAPTQVMERQSASFSRAEEAFKGQNYLWNKHRETTQGNRFEEIYRTNIETLNVVQTKTVQIFQSLQQRGTTAQFKAVSSANVRADGRSVRVPLGRATLQAKELIVAAPERSLNAARTLEMRNDSGQALLPGSVGIYQGSAFLGMTSLDFVADGESFGLYVSGADQLKLSRVLDKKHSALVRKQRTQMQLAFIVTVENLSTKPITVTIADRVPVSEEKEIVISGVHVSPDTKPDSKGILRWQITLAPKEVRRLEVGYQIEYPPTLILDAKRKRPSIEASPAPPGMPAAPMPAARSYDVKQDIVHLEAGF